MAGLFPKGIIKLLASFLVFCALALGIAVLYKSQTHSERLSKELKDVIEQGRNSEEAYSQLKQKWQHLQVKYDELQKKHEPIVQDRDNLLSQIKQVRSELETERQKIAEYEGRYEQAVADYKNVAEERELVEKLLKQSAQAQRALQGELVPLEERVMSLEKAYEQALKEREALKKELASAKEVSQVEAYKQELAAQQKEHEELKKVLSATKWELSEAKKQQQSVSEQLKRMQTVYAKLVSENDKLLRRVNTIPGQVGEMAKEHQKLIKENADMHYNLGVLFAGNKEYKQAVTEFQKVIELRPNDAEAYYNLGIIYADNFSNPDKAKEFFRKYLELNPKAKDAGWVKQYIASWQAWEAKERLE